MSEKEKMEHLVIDFKHDIRDVIPFCNFIATTRVAIEEKGIGKYLGDDMAIDGGDAEAFFSCMSALDLFEFLRGGLEPLTFMKGAKVRLVFGPLDAGSPEKVVHI